MAQAGAWSAGRQSAGQSGPHRSTALSRRGFLASAVAAAGAAWTTPALAVPAADQQLARLLDRLWGEQLRQRPELAGLPAAGGAHHDQLGRLSDWSGGSRGTVGDWARSALRRIAAIDDMALPQAAAVNRAVLIDHFGKIATLTERHPFGAAAGEADAPVLPYAISARTGPHRAVAALLLEGHPITVRADAEAWLNRLSQFPHALDAATEAFRADAARGIVPPAFALEAATRQLAALGSGSPATHPLVERLVQATGAAALPGAWRDKAAALVETALYPALERQIAALSAARPQSGAGIRALPEGAQFYADALAWHNGTSLSAEAAHALGQDQVAHLSGEMDGLLARLGLTGGAVGERLQALARRPEESFPAGASGRSAVLDAFAAAVEQLRPRLPALFALPEPDRLAVAQLPAALAGPGAEACLTGGQLAGTRPGTIYVNLQDLSAWPRYCIASTAFLGSLPAHLGEGAPGAAEDLPLIRRCGLRYGACADGWSLYAEQVADEQGFYARDPASRLGYLRTRLIHAARLVADTGLNGQGWSVDQTAQWLVTAAGLDPALARNEAETMAILPGKAGARAVGLAEWQRLRDLARRIAGTGFSQRRFDLMIQSGSAPFAVIEDLVVATFTRRQSVLVTRMV